ncbi:unnamed protein product [Dovyalis caffra]|uniref:Uncharacterized protein n=1 Tax=Dovyalis caffra TaxID=77055 RepID=A0AAV1RKS2_9ROSI|nr:unnamed protein product [Dovyalis caffra]
MFAVQSWSAMNWPSENRTADGSIVQMVQSVSGVENIGQNIYCYTVKPPFYLVDKTYQSYSSRFSWTSSCTYNLQDPLLEKWEDQPPLLDFKIMLIQLSSLLVPSHFTYVIILRSWLMIGSVIAV